MHVLTLALIGIACSVHGRRVQTSVSHTQNAVHPDGRTLRAGDSLAKVKGDDVEIISGSNPRQSLVQEQQISTPVDTALLPDSLAGANQTQSIWQGKVIFLLAMFAVGVLLAVAALLTMQAIAAIANKKGFLEVEAEETFDENRSASTQQADKFQRDKGSASLVKVKKISRKTTTKKSTAMEDEVPLKVDEELKQAECVDWEVVSSSSVVTTESTLASRMKAKVKHILPVNVPDPDKVSASLAQVTRVLAVDSSGEEVAEVLICVNSTVKDLVAAILKSAHIQGSDHGVQLTYDGAKLVGSQILQDVGMKPSTDYIVTVSISQRRTIRISFQPADAPKPEGYLIDCGQVFQDHGTLSYGWSHDNTDGCRKRNRQTNSLLDTFIIPDRKGKYDGQIHWKIALSPGDYEVKLGFSDPHPLHGRRDTNAGTMNGRAFDAGSSLPNKEVTMDMDVSGKYLRLVGSYPNMSALSYITIGGAPQRSGGSAALPRPT
jgi:hypothetical protein